METSDLVQARFRTTSGSGELAPINECDGDLSETGDGVRTGWDGICTPLGHRVRSRALTVSRGGRKEAEESGAAKSPATTFSANPE
jgi:hypothetical protein